MFDPDLIYLAGLFDGEGTIGYFSCGNDKSRLEMEIKMAHEPVIDWLVCRFGGYKKIRHQPLGRKTQWRWRVTGGKAKILYRELKPYLKVKNDFPL